MGDIDAVVNLWEFHNSSEDFVSESVSYRRCFNDYRYVVFVVYTLKDSLIFNYRWLVKDDIIEHPSEDIIPSTNRQHIIGSTFDLYLFERQTTGAAICDDPAEIM